MKIEFIRSEIFSWMLLVVLTCISWSLSGQGSGEWGQSVPLIMIAFLKVLLIGNVFMELSKAPLLLRAAFFGWVVITATMVSGIYLQLQR